MVDDAVAGIIAVQLGLAEHFAYETSILAASDQIGDLSVGRDTPFWDFTDDRKNLVNE